MSGVCVVHLVWAPLGLAPLRRFVRSYRDRSAGCSHELLVVFNGFSDDAVLDAARAELAGVAHHEHVLDAPVQDLEAYRMAAERVEQADALCFLNSHSELLVDGWLALLERVLRDEGVGIVGATGSHESAFSAAPRPLKPLRWRRFPPFPNPHIRTNAFMLRREDLLALDLRIGRSKTSAHELESGTRGITRQLLDRGLAARVVGRNGCVFPPEQWPHSRTFRSGRQENLLVADNRTRQFEDAAQERRTELARMAWGPGADVSAPLAPASQA